MTKGSMVIVIAAALAAVTYSCGGPKTIVQSDTPSDSGAEDSWVILEEKGEENPAHIKGLALIQENDCPSCHMEDEKSVGPSYVEIASKYEATDENITALATRIITGSVGIWGEIPMTDHSSLSRKEAEQMVNYILLLNN
jgi:cytochrome c